MDELAVIPLVLVTLLVIFAAPSLISLFVLYQRLRRQHQETLSALHDLNRGIQGLLLERKSLHLRPADALGSEDAVQEKTAELPLEESLQRSAESLDSLPPVAPDEFVEAVIVSDAPSRPAVSPGEGLERPAGDAVPKAPAATMAPARAARSPSDAGTLDTLKRIGNWFLFGRDSLPAGASIEVAIATNWLLRIGMAILVLGIAFFLKYSIDMGWVEPVDRVLLGTAAGLGMIAGGSFLLSGRYRLLAHGLQGGGVVTLYLSIYAATVFLELIDPIPLGFALMACVTALAWLLALIFGSPLTAVLGIVGGYFTPVVLPSEEIAFFPLFSYLAILGLGVLAISTRRSWPQLNLLSFLGTYALAFSSFAAVYSDKTNRIREDYWVILFFLVVFFFLFSLVVFLSSRVRGRANLWDLAMLWLNAFFFFGLGIAATRLWLEVTHLDTEWMAMIPLGIAAFCSAGVYLQILRRSQDTVLFHTMLGQAAVFAALAVPIVLSESWITFAWSVQAAVMLWLAFRLDSRFLRMAAWILFTVTAVRFFISDIGTEKQFILDWRGDFVADLSRWIPRLTAMGGSILCVAWAASLSLRRAGPLSDRLRSEKDLRELRVAGRAIAVLAAVMLFGYGTRETAAAIGTYFGGLQSGAVSIWWAVFAIALVTAGLRRSRPWVRRAGLFLFAIVACKVLLYDLRTLATVYRFIAFVIVGLVILGGAVLYLRFTSLSGENVRKKESPSR